METYIRKKFYGKCRRKFGISFPVVCVPLILNAPERRRVDLINT